MRKQDPNDVVAAFVERLSESHGTWQSMREKIGNSGLLAKRSSVDAFLRCAVAFENFRSDWHMAAINRDSSAFKADLALRVQQRVMERWKGLDGRIRVDLPSHPSLSLVQQLIDPLGRNVSVGTGDGWKDRAQRELAPIYRDRVAALRSADDSLVDCVVAIRNLLVHESTSASDVMNEALRSLDGNIDRALRRGPNRVRPSGIGSYLNANWNGHRRVEIYNQRLAGIAESLKVPEAVDVLVAPDGIGH